MPIIAFIETSDLGTRYCAEAARALGFSPLFVTRMTDYQGDTLTQLRKESTLVCDTTDAHSVARALEDFIFSDQIAAVTTFLDSRLEIAVEAARLLGVPGPDAASAVLKCKAEVARLIPDFSPASFELQADIAASWSALGDWLAKDSRHGRGILIKPSKAAGALGVLAAQSGTAAGLEQIIREHLANTKLAKHLDSPGWLIQERAGGSLFSLEGFIYRGEIHVLGVSGRKKVGQTESCLIFPEVSSVSELQTGQMTAVVRALATRSGFDNGYFHTEFMIDGDRMPLLIDANFGRLGGGALIEQVAIAYGMSPSNLAAHILAVSLPGLGADEQSLRPLLIADQKLVPTLGILYGLREEGNLASISSSNSDAQVIHTRLLEDGQLIPAMGLNNWAWVGALAGPAPSVNAAIGRMRAQVVRNGQRMEEALCF